MCTSPMRIKNPDYDFYDSSLYIEVPCGKCMECKLNYTKQWAMRVMHELQYYSNSCFITLTYDDDKLPYGWNKEKFPLDKRELQKFFKRLRKRLGNNHKIKYFACGEYGGKFGRPHFHAIILNWFPNDTDKYGNSKILTELWPFGFVKVGTVNYNSARYVASYIVKKKKGIEKNYYKDNGLNPEFVLMSQGLGKRFCLEHKEQMEQLGYILFNGYKTPIPRYYLDKIYDTENKQKQRKEYLNEYFKGIEQDSRKQFETMYDRYIDYCKRHSCRRCYTFNQFVEIKRYKERLIREERLRAMIERTRDE